MHASPEARPCGSKTPQPTAVRPSSFGSLLWSSTDDDGGAFADPPGTVGEARDVRLESNVAPMFGPHRRCRHHPPSATPTKTGTTAAAPTPMWLCCFVQHRWLLWFDDPAVEEEFLVFYMAQRPLSIAYCMGAAVTCGVGLLVYSGLSTTTTAIYGGAVLLWLVCTVVFLGWMRENHGFVGAVGGTSGGPPSAASAASASMNCSSSRHACAVVDWGALPLQAVPTTTHPSLNKASTTANLRSLSGVLRSFLPTATDKPKQHCTTQHDDNSRHHLLAEDDDRRRPSNKSYCSVGFGIKLS